MPCVYRDEPTAVKFFGMIKRRSEFNTFRVIREIRVIRESVF